MKASEEQYQKQLEARRAYEEAKRSSKDAFKDRDVRVKEARAELEKQKRDLSSVKEIGEFLLQKRTQQKKIIDIFDSLPKKWQKTILSNLKDNSRLLFDFLSKKKS